MDKNDFNTVKGIGIFMVVFGHVCSNFPSLVGFFYLFHLSLFFFVSGYLWNEEKYGDNPWQNFAARIKNTWERYFFAAATFVLLHNWFIDIGVLVNVERHTKDQMVISLITSSMLNCTEIMASAMWFIPLVVISSTVFSAFVMLGRKIEGKFSNRNCKYLLIAVLSVLSGILGHYTTSRGWGFHYNMQVTFLVIPIYAAAYFLRNAISDIKRCLKWYLALPLCVLLVYGMRNFNWVVELGRYQVCESLWIFCLVSFSGIYVSLYVAKLIGKVKYLSSYFRYIGTYSFEIMAWHLLVVKLVDVCYAKIIGETNVQVYGVFTNAYASKLWFMYLILGTLIPATGAHFMYGLKRRVETKRASAIGKDVAI